MFSKLVLLFTLVNAHGNLRGPGSNVTEVVPSTNTSTALVNVISKDLVIYKNQQKLFDDNFGMCPRKTTDYRWSNSSLDL
jgi:hypothetical protein